MAGPRPPGDRVGRLGDQAFSALITAMGGAILIVGGVIVAACYGLARPALAKLGWLAFLVGRDWNPVEDSFGALPFIYGTLVTSSVALLVAVPVSLGLAIFLTEMAPGVGRLRSVVAFFVELMAAIPSVVYGLWGVMVLVPLLRDVFGSSLVRLGGLPLVGALFRGPLLGPSYLAGGLILGVMILPTVATVSVEVLRTAPAVLREGALALGATRWEAVRVAVLPYARRGILGAVLLGLARALGETMAVTMVIGNQPEIHASLLAPGYSLPSVIANEFAEATGAVHTGALAALALVLFGVTLLLAAGARVLLGLSNAPRGAP